MLWQNTFEIYLLGLFTQNTLCFTIRLPIVSHLYHTYPTVMQIIVSNLQKINSAHIGRPLCLSATVGAMLAPPSPLPWLPRCRHHCKCLHCQCHYHGGCRHLRCHQHRFCCYCYCFLVDCCLPLPCAASASATVACPRRCRNWLSTPLPL